MINLPIYHNQSIAIVGLGKTGIAAAKALRAAGANVLLWDDTHASCLALPAEFASAVQPPEQWDWRALDAVLLSPGIALTHPAPHPVVQLAQSHSVRITSDIELLCEACSDATFVAITGTNGKSTTTALIGHILREAGAPVQVGGNIGQPALGLNPMARGDICVLELSSYQLDLLRQRAHFNVAVWMNISPDHLDRHGDLEGYIAAKKWIFANQSKDDVAVIGVDDAASEAVARELIAAKQQRVVPICVTQQCSEGVWVKDGQLHAGDAVLELAALQALRGAHNHQNAAAAYAACRALGIAHAQIESGMSSFAGLAHRMQKIAEAEGIAFVNDSKATNADAAEKSLGSFDAIYWIAGGVPKAGGIEPLAPYFPRIRKAYLIGQAQEEFAQTLGDHVPYARCDSLQAATHAAYADATAAIEKGSVVLLAPACASFDQFANFEQRGEVFTALAQDIAARAKAEKVA